MTSVTVVVDLDEFDDEDLIEELECRGYGIRGRNRDVSRLADLIAEGDTRAALDLLADMFPGEFTPETAIYLASLRGAQA
jgi:hypothetical protein